MLSTALFAAALTLACPPPLPLDLELEPAAAPSLTPDQRWEAVEAQVKIIRGVGRLNAAKIGYGGEASKSYRAFEALLEIAEDADLEGLLSDRAPAVRLYAMWGLLLRGHAADTLLARLPGQEERVDSQSGCMMWRATVGELAEMLARNQF